MNYLGIRGKIDENDYTKNKGELYAAIKLLTEEKKQLNLSFDPDKLLNKNDYF